MSVHDFQLALARLIASPHLCRLALDNEASYFSVFELSEKERSRLHCVLRQKGMSACCTLYRMNRVTPVYLQLSNTSALLGDAFVPVVQDFWKHLADTSLQFKEEVLAFGAFLREKIENGSIRIPYLKEVLQLEVAMNELSYCPEGEFRFLTFDHDIYTILYAITNNTLASTLVQPCQTTFKMYIINDEIKMDEMLDDIHMPPRHN